MLSKDVSAALCRSFRLTCLTIPPSKTFSCSLPSYESVHCQALSCSWIVNKTLAVKSRYFILHATTICNLRRLFLQYFTNSFMRTASCSFYRWHYADDDIMWADIKKEYINKKKKSKTSGVVWPLSHNGMWNVLCCHKMYLGLDLYCISVCFSSFFNRLSCKTIK